jgi:2-oxoglutarate dehydrogenase E2 component (dihydrolipoamide succinyltransferase)
VGTLLDVLSPANEEGTRATVLRWCRKVGECVAENEPLVELETDKVTVEVPAPATGELVEILRNENDAVEAGTLLARLRIADAPAAAASAPLSPAGAAVHGARPAPAVSSRVPLSPAVRRLLGEHRLSATQITGSGRDGRITAQDVIRHAGTLAPAAQAEHRSPSGDLVGPAPPAAASGASRYVPHSALRRRIAQHMAHSVAVAPHVTTLFEIDLSRVMTHKRQHAAQFESEGAKLTLTAYFVVACARALQSVPEINSSFHEDALELHSDCNIAIGTALGNDGLIAPVLHRAQLLDLRGTAQALHKLVAAARAGKLVPGEVRGGTFTISNHGVSGSILAAPVIINQPQVAILGIGKAERRVIVRQLDGEDVLRVRPMAYVTLTIDHRALDAFQANAFLTHVAATLEHWPET